LPDAPNLADRGHRLRRRQHALRYEGAREGRGRGGPYVGSGPGGGRGRRGVTRGRGFRGLHGEAQGAGDGRGLPGGVPIREAVPRGLRCAAGDLRRLRGVARGGGPRPAARERAPLQGRGPEGATHGLERVVAGARPPGVERSRWGVLLFCPLLLPGAGGTGGSDRGDRVRGALLRGRGAREPRRGAVSPGEEQRGGVGPLRELSGVVEDALMAFTVFPAIDLRGGKCVRLVQGDFGRSKEYDADPVSRAREWERRGGEAVHVVDLDGAKEGRPVQADLIGKISRAVGVPVQAGGGIRSIEDIRRLREAGASRVVVGTAAVEDRDLRLRAVEELGPALVVAVDARSGVVATHGWQRSSGVPLLEMAEEISEDGVASVLYTDVARDGVGTGAALEDTAALARVVPTIASGGVRDEGDVAALSRLDGVVGVVVGTALYEGRASLEDLIRAARTG